MTEAQEPTAMVLAKPLEWGRDHIDKVWHGNVVPNTGPNYLLHDDGRWCLDNSSRRWVLDQIGDVEAAKVAIQADYEQRIRAALASLPAQGTEWQPISTAPKDGAPLDLLSDTGATLSNVRWGFDAEGEDDGMGWVNRDNRFARGEDERAMRWRYHIAALNQPEPTTGGKSWVLRAEFAQLIGSAEAFVTGTLSFNLPAVAAQQREALVGQIERASATLELLGGKL